MIYSTTSISPSALRTKSSNSTHVHVAIVGAGPRGTSTLERLCASASGFLAPGARLTVHVVDPSPPGAGRVWRTAQSQDLLMNTVASQVTLFTDSSVVCEGPILSGPSLYTWAKGVGSGLGVNDYATRSQYGRYLEWVFEEAVRRAPSNVEVKVHAARAVRLDDTREGSQSLTLSTGRTLPGLAAVVLAQGHLPLLPDPEQNQHILYAQSHGLRYITPSNPADVDLSSLAPGEPVLLRGIGLNFFDYMALLTMGRGGRFTRTSSGLRYQASGKEPRLYAGSRRGVPYHSRGDNSKGPYERHIPLLFTDEVIASFQNRVNSKDTDFMSEIWPLVAKEVETIYYEAVFKQRRSERPDFRNRFLAIPHGSPEEVKLLDEFGVTETDRWSWERISRPYSGKTFTTTSAWRDWLLTYLREDAKQASLGNVDGPLKAALDVMRDLRNELRLIIDHDGLSAASRRDHLDRWYTPLNGYLSIGPPRERVEQMIALMDAGVLEVLGPRLEVQLVDGAWQVKSLEIPDSPVRVTTLVEARLPEPNCRHTADELLAHLLKTGQCRPHTVDGYETGGLDITRSPYHVINRYGHKHARRFAVGIPTEGVHWLTAAGVRPGVNSVTLTDTDAVARAALQEARAEVERIVASQRTPSHFPFFHMVEA